jgi:hypothetical protein
MSFADYFYYLLHRIFKRAPRDGSDADQLARALGPNYDDAQEAIFLLREKAFVATATGKALDELGRERGLVRYSGESDEYYRQRLLAAYSLHASSGTAASVRRVLNLLGYPKAYIHELYKDGVVYPLFNGQYRYDGAINHTGGLRWSEFKIVSDLDEDRSLTAEDVRVLVDAINRIKPAHTKLAAFALDLTLGPDRIPLEDAVSLTGKLSFTDSAVGSQDDHRGGLRHDGQALYNAWSLADRLKLRIKVRPVLNEVLPGTCSYTAAFRHDGGGARWRHAGSRIRGPYQVYSGAATHSGFSRWVTWSRYGDKVATHNGRRRYNYGRLHDGSTLRGSAGIADELRLVIKRRGQVIEDYHAIA